MKLPNICICLGLPSVDIVLIFLFITNLKKGYLCILKKNSSHLYIKRIYFFEDLNILMHPCGLRHSLFCITNHSMCVLSAIEMKWGNTVSSLWAKNRKKVARN